MKRRGPHGFFVPSNYGGPVQIGNRFFARGGKGRELTRDEFLRSSKSYLSRNKDFQYLAPKSWFKKSAPKPDGTFHKKVQQPIKQGVDVRPIRKRKKPPKRELYNRAETHRTPEAVPEMGRRRDSKRFGGKKTKRSDYLLTTGKRSAHYTVYATYRTVVAVRYEGHYIPANIMMAERVGVFTPAEFMANHEFQNDIIERIEAKGDEFEFVGFSRSPYVQRTTGKVNQPRNRS